MTQNKNDIFKIGDLVAHKILGWVGRVTAVNFNHETNQCADVFVKTYKGLIRCNPEHLRRLS